MSSGGVQNGVGHVPGRVPDGGPLGRDGGLPRNTGPQRGRGELDGLDVEVPEDAGVRDGMLGEVQESRGFFSSLLGIAGAFFGRMHPGLLDDDEAPIPEDHVPGRPVDDEEDPGLGEVDEDGTVWYDVEEAPEEELDRLREIPLSRRENLRMDKESALLREGLRVGREESSEVEARAPREIEPMYRGFMQTVLGSAYAAWDWLRGGVPSDPVPRDTRSLSEQNLGQIDQLQVDTAKCLQKLDEQIRRVKGESLLDKDKDPSRINPDVSSLALRDHAWRWGETAKAAFSEAVATLGWCTAGAGVAYGGSTLSSLVGGGVSGQLVSILGGSYLALSALRDLPGNVTDQTAISVIEKNLVEINRLLGQARQLIVQERQRQALSEKLGMVSQGRLEAIERLELELEVVDRHVAGRKEPGTGDDVVESRPRLPVVVGDGSQHGETLSGMARVRQAFSSFFAPVVQGLARAGRFLGDALGLTSLSALRKEDRAEGRAYEKTFSQGLRLLRRPSQDSIVDRARVQETARRMLGLSREQPADPREVQRRVRQLDRQIESIRPVLCLGENVVRHVRDGSGGAFGTLIVSDKDGGKYIVNSGRPAVHAMCHYLDMLARDVGEKNTLGVRVDDSGGLVLRDPGRRLYQFLAGAPQAMTSLFMHPVGAGSEWRAATEHAGRMWINDSSGQLPGGANRVVFEIGVEGGEDVLMLRFERLDRDELVSSVLDVPEHSMLKQLRMMDVAYRDAHRSGQRPVDGLDDEELMRRHEGSNKRLGIAGEDYGRWSLESLQNRRELLLGRLAREQVLLQRDNDSHQLLQNDDRLLVVSQRI